MSKKSDTIKRHIVQWTHNRAMIDSVPATHADWIVTVMFYAAVHAIDAALASKDSYVSNHDGRFDALKQHNSFKNIRNYYHGMYDLCRKVRYSADPSLWIPPSRIEPDVAKGFLYPIERSVEGLLGRSVGVLDLDLSRLVTPPPPATAVV